MRQDEFESEVRSRSKFSHMVGFTDHARDRAKERDISLRQMLNALRKGQVCASPTYDAAHGTWAGTMEYHGTGRRVRVTCAIDDGDLTVTVVTTF